MFFWQYQWLSLLQGVLVYRRNSSVSIVTECSQNRQAIKYGHESRETQTKNYCAGEDQQQFSSQ
jgi:hypothetical protein